MLDKPTEESVSLDLNNYMRKLAGLVIGELNSSCGCDVRIWRTNVKREDKTLIGKLVLDDLVKGKWLALFQIISTIEFHISLSDQKMCQRVDVYAHDPRQAPVLVHQENLPGFDDVKTNIKIARMITDALANDGGYPVWLLKADRPTPAPEPQFSLHELA